ncbi:helix-turn-helix domain-containing protein [Formosa sp. A9]|uniref:helix-turn-helix domain-containing protein n=1 Tax=Formosa sp. A9 TaxID=3442641 RepID=UPI003EBE9AF3
MDNKAKKQYLETIGGNLKIERESQGLSYRELAQLCDVDHSQISKIEKGLINIQITTLIELAKGLNIKAKDLIDF